MTTTEESLEELNNLFLNVVQPLTCIPVQRELCGNGRHYLPNYVLIFVKNYRDMQFYQYNN